MYKSETIFSNILAISLFSIILLISLKWQQNKNLHNLHNFYEKQALQIIENQIELRNVGMPCENSTKINSNQYLISCNKNSIKVRINHLEFKVEKD